MSKSHRRRFLKSSAAVTVGFMGLRHACHPSFSFAAEQGEENAQGKEKAGFGYGRIYSDPKGILDLPDGFSYKIISEKNGEMDDGLVVPGAPDGMAAFRGPYGLTVIIRNHELNPDNTGPFGENRERLKMVALSKLYDPGRGETPCAGGTSTLVYDTKSQHKVREFMSLAGTTRNCAGGPTPWKTWVSCEETMDKVGENGKDEEDENSGWYNEKDHGYNFEVPVTARMALTDPIPLIDMGRFNHEAIAVDPKTGIVYQTEDRDDGIFFRFIPKQAGKLHAGGKLQALVVADQKSLDTRNWKDAQNVRVGDELSVSWIDIENVTSPEDDLREQGFNAGAAKFARGEGIWYGNGEFFFACTSGGKAEIGQIWRYRPSLDEGSASEEKSPGKLELFIEPNDTNLVHNADNLTIAPWGDLVVCEDRSGQVIRLVGVTPDGKIYPFAMNHMNTEFAGVCFSPDGGTLFVNIQGAGMTLAVTGPWKKPTTV